MNKRLFTFSCCLVLMSVCIHAQELWTVKKANEWYKHQPWPLGANFLPSTAINQLEMWQATTFDTITIARELQWAHTIGMNVMRVYLHDLAWKEDAAGFKQRMTKYLSIAADNKIKTVFVFFDDCWNPDPVIGRQPAPKPGVHNSGWVRSPSRAVHDDSTQWNYLQEYVTDILTSFKKDKRILLWDLYNEPGNSSYGMKSMPLLTKVFAWARAVDPSQPLTSGVWSTDLPGFNAFQLSHSDVITFHNYSDTVSLNRTIDSLQSKGRPLICTEYMARTKKSLIETHLPILKKDHVGAINWGLVSGKSNTIYPWDNKEGAAVPDPWFHDIFHKDGKAYNEKETLLIKQLSGK